MSRGKEGDIAKNGEYGLHNEDARQFSRRLAPGVIGICLLLLLASALVIAPGARAGSLHGAVLKVPSQYPTIQSAVAAAHAGDTILVAPGTYREAFDIDKSITLTGSGSGKTIIQSPTALGDHVATISTLNGATVALSGFTVLVTNLDGAGVLVVLGSTAVIHDNSIQALSPGSEGIEVRGASATITSNVIVATTTPVDGNENGIVVWDGSQATITYNSIIGPGENGVVLIGASATVSYNSISQFECGNVAQYVADGLCGLSFANQLQSAGIFDENDAGLGTTISNNIVTSTDVGIGLWGGCPACIVKGDLVMGAVDYALLGSDGTYTFSQILVIGGPYAVASIGYTTNTSVTLSHVLMVGQSVPPPAYYYEDACLEVFGYTCTETIGGS
jgi:parallel beta helix pectate lyase-like protein